MLGLLRSFVARWRWSSRSSFRQRALLRYRGSDSRVRFIDAREQAIEVQRYSLWRFESKDISIFRACAVLRGTSGSLYGAYRETLFEKLFLNNFDNYFLIFYFIIAYPYSCRNIEVIINLILHKVFLRNHNNPCVREK